MALFVKDVALEIVKYLSVSDFENLLHSSKRFQDLFSDLPRKPCSITLNLDILWEKVHDVLILPVSKF